MNLVPKGMNIPSIDNRPIVINLPIFPMMINLLIIIPSFHLVFQL
jgi:hypothetical protein